MTVVAAAPSRRAGVSRRLFAATFDWIVCLIVPFFLAGSLWFVIVPLTVAAYFACFFFVGRTPGMRLASIRLVDQRTGVRPRAGRAVARSLAALLQATSCAVLLVFVFSDVPNGGYSFLDGVAFVVCSLIALAALVGHAWIILGPSRRTLLDRLFGLMVVGQDGLTSR